MTYKKKKQKSKSSLLKTIDQYQQDMGLKEDPVFLNQIHNFEKNWKNNNVKVGNIATSFLEAANSQPESWSRAASALKRDYFDKYVVQYGLEGLAQQAITCLFDTDVLLSAELRDELKGAYENALKLGRDSKEILGAGANIADDILGTTEEVWDFGSRLAKYYTNRKSEYEKIKVRTVNNNRDNELKAFIMGQILPRITRDIANSLAAALRTDVCLEENVDSTDDVDVEDVSSSLSSVFGISSSRVPDFMAYISDVSGFLTPSEMCSLFLGSAEDDVLNKAFFYLNVTPEHNYVLMAIKTKQRLRQFFLLVGRSVDRDFCLELEASSIPSDLCYDPEGPTMQLRDCLGSGDRKKIEKIRELSISSKKETFLKHLSLMVPPQIQQAEDELSLSPYDKRQREIIREELEESVGEYKVKIRSSLEEIKNNYIVNKESLKKIGVVSGYEKEEDRVKKYGEFFKGNKKFEEIIKKVKKLKEEKEDLKKGLITDSLITSFWEGLTVNEWELFLEDFIAFQKTMVVPVPEISLYLGGQDRHYKLRKIALFNSNLIQGSVAISTNYNEKHIFPGIHKFLIATDENVDYFVGSQNTYEWSLLATKDNENDVRNRISNFFQNLFNSPLFNVKYLKVIDNFNISSVSYGENIALKGDEGKIQFSNRVLENINYYVDDKKELGQLKQYASSVASSIEDVATRRAYLTTFNNDDPNALSRSYHPIGTIDIASTKKEVNLKVEKTEPPHKIASKNKYYLFGEDEKAFKREFKTTYNQLVSMCFNSSIASKFPFTFTNPIDDNGYLSWLELLKSSPDEDKACEEFQGDLINFKQIVDDLTLIDLEKLSEEIGETSLEKALSLLMFYKGTMLEHIVKNIVLYSEFSFEEEEVEELVVDIVYMELFENSLEVDSEMKENSEIFQNKSQKEKEHFFKNIKLDTSYYDKNKGNWKLERKNTNFWNSLIEENKTYIKMSYELSRFLLHYFNLQNPQGKEEEFCVAIKNLIRKDMSSLSKKIKEFIYTERTMGEKNFNLEKSFFENKINMFYFGDGDFENKIFDYMKKLSRKSNYIHPYYDDSYYSYYHEKGEDQKTERYKKYVKYLDSYHDEQAKYISSIIGEDCFYLTDIDKIDSNKKEVGVRIYLCSFKKDKLSNSKKKEIEKKVVRVGANTGRLFEENIRRGDEKFAEETLNFYVAKYFNKKDSKYDKFFVYYQEEPIVEFKISLDKYKTFNKNYEKKYGKEPSGKQFFNNCLKHDIVDKIIKDYPDLYNLHVNVFPVKSMLPYLVANLNSYVRMLANLTIDYGEEPVKNVKTMPSFHGFMTSLYKNFALSVLSLASPSYALTVAELQFLQNKNKNKGTFQLISDNVSFDFGSSFLKSSLRNYMSIVERSEANISISKKQADMVAIGLNRVYASFKNTLSSIDGFLDVLGFESKEFEDFQQGLSSDEVEKVFKYILKPHVTPFSILNISLGILPTNWAMWASYIASEMILLGIEISEDRVASQALLDLSVSGEDNGSAAIGNIVREKCNSLFEDDKTKKRTNDLYTDGDEFTLKDGKFYKGPYHTHPDGRIMTGEKHSPDSKVLTRQYK